MSTYEKGFDVTPDLIRQKNLVYYVVFPIVVILSCLWGSLVRWYCYEYFDMDAPLWGIHHLARVLFFTFLATSVYLMIPLLGGPLFTWFKVRRSNLMHAIVENLNQGNGLYRAYYDSSKTGREHFYTADDKKLEIKSRTFFTFILFILAVIFIPITCFLIHVFTNDVGDFDVYLLVFSVAGILVIFQNLCCMKRHLSFNRIQGTFTYFGFLLPWHRDIKFDKVQINAYANTFKIIIPYRLFPLRMIGEYKDAQAWWSYYMWYMDRNRPLPPGSLFTEEVREEDYLRRREAGFPAPLYPSSIDTPEWEGAISKYGDLDVEKRNRSLYKGSTDMAIAYLDRKSYLREHTYIKKG